MTPRIALVAHRLAAPQPTGIGRYYQEIAPALAALTASGAPYRYVAAAPREPDQPEWVRPPLEYVAIPGPRRLVQAAWTLAYRPRVDRALGRPALVHVLHPWAPVPTRAPLVVTFHDLFPITHPEWGRRDEGFALRRGMRYARDHAAAIVAISEWTADQVCEHLDVERDRVSVVHMGIGDEFRAPPAADEVAAACDRHGVTPGAYLICVGGLTARKNIDTVLRAVAELDPARGGVLPVLVTGPAGREPDARTDRLRAVGFVSRLELVALLRGALALVHPSRGEGFGFTPLEAMAVGTPALVSNAGALPEAVGDAAVLLDPDDVDAWAAAIERIVTDPDHRAGLVERGVTRQAGFRWHRAAAETMEVHRRVLESR